MTERDIKIVFNELRNELNAREVTLLEELKEMHQEKESDLKWQKESLDTAVQQFSGPVKFAESLLKGGNDLEVYLCKDQTVQQLNHVATIQCLTEPIQDPSIEFVANNREAVIKTIKQVGSLDSNMTSPKRSALENVKAGMHCQINQPFTFDVTAMKQDGKRVEKGSDGFMVEISGPSTSQAQLEDGKNGKYTVSFTPNRAGNHMISVKLKGINIINSPFSILVTQAPVLPKPLLPEASESMLSKEYKRYQEVKSIIGFMGSGDGQFRTPRAITCNSKGHIIVADSSNHRVEVFDTPGKLLLKFGLPGNGIGEFNYPSGIAVDHKDNIFVADTNNHRVQIFNSKGTFIQSIGSQGSEEGQLYGPIGLAISKSGLIVVSENGNHRIQIFEANGRSVRCFGFLGNGDGQLKNPIGLTLNSQDDIIVADYGNSRIQVFDIMGKFKEILGKIQLRSISHLKSDKNDSVFICEYHNHRIVVLDKDGQLIHTFGQGLLSSPFGITIDDLGRAIICETGNNRVSIF